MLATMLGYVGGVVLAAAQLCWVAPAVWGGGAASREAAIESNNLGVRYLAEGRLPESEDCFKRAIRIWEELAGSDDVWLVRPLNNLIRVHLARGEYGAAARLVARATHIGAGGVPPEDRARLLGSQATILQERGDFGAARKLVLQSVEIWRTVDGRQGGEIAALLNNLGYLSVRAGKRRDAFAEFEQSISVWSSLPPSARSGAVDPLLNLAKLFAASGRLGEAESALERARTLALAARPPHPRYGEVLEQYAAVLRKQGRKTEARQFVNAAREVGRQCALPAAPTIDIDDLRGSDKKRREN